MMRMQTSIANAALLLETTCASYQQKYTHYGNIAYKPSLDKVINLQMERKYANTMMHMQLSIAEAAVLLKTI